MSPERREVLKLLALMFICGAMVGGGLSIRLGRAVQQRVQQEAYHQGLRVGLVYMGCVAAGYKMPTLEPSRLARLFAQRERITLSCEGLQAALGD